MQGVGVGWSGGKRCVVLGVKRRVKTDSLPSRIVCTCEHIREKNCLSTHGVGPKQLRQVAAEQIRKDTRETTTHATCHMPHATYDYPATCHHRDTTQADTRPRAQQHKQRARLTPRAATSPAAHPPHTEKHGPHKSTRRVAQRREQTTPESGARHALMGTPWRRINQNTYLCGLSGGGSHAAESTPRAPLPRLPVATEHCQRGSGRGAMRGAAAAGCACWRPSSEIKWTRR
jgi:hypothetical protein